MYSSQIFFSSRVYFPYLSLKVTKIQAGSLMPVVLEALICIWTYLPAAHVITFFPKCEYSLCVNAISFTCLLLEPIYLFGVKFVVQLYYNLLWIANEYLNVPLLLSCSETLPAVTLPWCTNDVFFLNINIYIYITIHCIFLVHRRTSWWRPVMFVT